MCYVYITYVLYEFYIEWKLEPIDRRWYVHTPNYYFPKIDNYSDLKAATTIFLMSSIGLLAVISCLLILLHKTAVRTREQRELQNQLQSISELLDSNYRNEDDEPPIYEAPPEYDEVINFDLEEKCTQNELSNLKETLQSETPNAVLESETPSVSETDSNQNTITYTTDLNLLIDSKRIVKFGFN